MRDRGSNVVTSGLWPDLLAVPQTEAKKSGLSISTRPAKKCFSANQATIVRLTHAVQLCYRFSSGKSLPENCLYSRSTARTRLENSPSLPFYLDALLHSLSPDHPA